MDKRPELCIDLDSAVFRDFYYLKEELVCFCKENGLPASGGKPELTERIACYLDTGTVLPAVTRKRASSADIIDENTVIGENFVCSEKLRAFFKERIGKSFSFNVAFMKWLKSNAGKTCGDAIDAYYQILSEKKNSKSTIDRQFEYNTYIRDFFADNKDKSLQDAIKCWKHKKQLPGHNRYESADLAALEQ